MRFEFEKLDIPYILRRVHDMERGEHGRRITRVILSLEEWMEFIHNRYPNSSIRPVRLYHIARPLRPTTAFGPDDPIEPVGIETIDVVCES